MHARGIGDAVRIAHRNLLIISDKKESSPVGRQTCVPGSASRATTRKNLRTHLSTAAVDFFETHGMKHLAPDFAIQREFLEHYKVTPPGMPR
jgi:hypothetical protein